MYSQKATSVYVISQYTDCGLMVGKAFYTNILTIQRDYIPICEYKKNILIQSIPMLVISILPLLWSLQFNASHTGEAYNRLKVYVGQLKTNRNGSV